LAYILQYEPILSYYDLRLRSFTVLHSD